MRYKIPYDITPPWLYAIEVQGNFFNEAFTVGSLRNQTDNIVNYPCKLQEVQERNVDCVAQVDQIGDPKNIMSGTTKITEDPMKLQIAHDCVDLMDTAGLIKNGMVFQSGAGEGHSCSVPRRQDWLR